MQASLDEDLLAELELDEQKSFEEMVKQVMREAQTELAVFEALEDCGRAGGITDSDVPPMEKVYETSDRGYESDWSWEEDDICQTRGETSTPSQLAEVRNVQNGWLPTNQSKN